MISFEKRLFLPIEFYMRLPCSVCLPVPRGKTFKVELFQKNAPPKTEESPPNARIAFIPSNLQFGEWLPLKLEEAQKNQSKGTTDKKEDGFLFVTIDANAEKDGFHGGVKGFINDKEVIGCYVHKFNDSNMNIMQQSFCISVPSGSNFRVEPISGYRDEKDKNKPYPIKAYWLPIVHSAERKSIEGKSIEVKSVEMTSEGEKCVEVKSVEVISEGTKSVKVMSVEVTSEGAKSEGAKSVEIKNVELKRGGINHKMQAAIEISANTQITAATDGILYGWIQASRGPGPTDYSDDAGTLKVYTDDDAINPNPLGLPLAAASMHYVRDEKMMNDKENEKQKKRKVFILCSSIMLPITKGTTYKVAAITSGKPKIHLFWTAIIPS